ncbi:sigma-54-dependent transcriptional regulator [Chitinophaga sancti]|uniref:DNA-binding transcriptional response regulator, NtrC family, contains REC, AAA-type ATPase, and a Fis-type DNA-binding domains n=1 Tax=Chitinophaga sancti TaxID=1004 RepID=A0A1K1RUV8_9BACT|nr:sigma-54 dependent transcriptional regulator [Chitinophaga sancti]WQD62338.1 sigma-54 dependent transcriptional regulator [Chitinophaga sancti]WQG92093.1 sigma-54 dependent transcriptional regulator [Chitinophaga sancti]SFW75849.1 DNA-binding transcriptional response regulator, NtrC family, contains REC, AAA-type ATPase, and a Fis-type DNA-binding domains [Chitinophaga sancti]
MAQFSIYIVEDDPLYGEILEYQLSMNPDYIIRRFNSGSECLKELYKRPDLVTIDYSMPDMNGLTLFKKIRDFNPDLPVVVISGQDDINTAVEFLKMGVTDYLVKDDNVKSKLWNSIIRIRENQSLRQEVAELKEELGRKYEFEKIIKGASPALRKVFTLLEKASNSEINVSLTGETGTGKELAAKAIHYNSNRKKYNFVAVNLAAIPRELIESELFGHEKGAFTGAIARKQGRFEDANKGTLFLDEIAEADLNIQTKLLRVLQERELSRIGGNEIIHFNVRLIVATHKNLEEEVQKGNFREDLYYRILGLPIELPPLRDRGSDVILLANSFIEEACKKNNIRNVLKLSAPAKEKLLKYNFPGNIRELKAIIDLACILCNGDEIIPEDIRFSGTRARLVGWQEDKTMEDYYIDIVQAFLKKYDNNVVLVARKLKIGKSTIYKLINNNKIHLTI